MFKTIYKNIKQKMTSEVILDSSSPIITINQSSLFFKINQKNFRIQSKINTSSRTLYPLSETELLLTNLTSSYIAYRTRITKKKFYSVEPSHIIMSPNSNITIKITFYHNFSLPFPPEGHKFRFEGIVIPSNMKRLDARNIYEEYSRNKTEVKGNSIRKVAEFIYDNDYNPDFSGECNKLEMSQSMNNINEISTASSVYSMALGRSNERPSRISLKNKKNYLKGINSYDPKKLKEECEKLQEEYDNNVKELNELRNKINEINSKNKYRYVVPDIEFSSVNKKMIFILFTTAFFLGFWLTK